MSPVAAPFESISRIAPADFRFLCDLARERFGLDLREGKQDMVIARLATRVRANGLRSFREYCDMVRRNPGGDELTAIVDALSTNYTSFFRERAHFDFLAESLLPAWPSNRPLSIWSAGCATGEEPYSLACFVLEKMRARQTPLHIIGTDISTRALRCASFGAYQKEKLETFPAAWARRYLLRGQGRWAGWYRFKPQVRHMVQFARVNLVTDFETPGRFPVIFCRNVMIYFDKPVREIVVNRLCGCLEPGGMLFIGLSESLGGIAHPLTQIRPGVYRLPSQGARAL